MAVVLRLGAMTFMRVAIEMKTSRKAFRLHSLYTINRFDRIVLGYGALCGFLFVLYLSGNPLLAIFLGVPPGIFGFGIAMLVHKQFSTGSDYAAISVDNLRGVSVTVVITITLLLSYRALVGDWFGFAVAIMMAGGFFLFVANAYGYFR